MGCNCLGGSCPWRIVNSSIISDSWPLLPSSTNITLGRHERSLLPTFSPHHHRRPRRLRRVQVEFIIPRGMGPFATLLSQYVCPGKFMRFHKGPTTSATHQARFGPVFGVPRKYRIILTTAVAARSPICGQFSVNFSNRLEHCDYGSLPAMTVSAMQVFYTHWIKTRVAGTSCWRKCGQRHLSLSDGKRRR